MLNPSRQFPHMTALADYVEAEAAGIRERAHRASTASQLTMRAEAAAYERVAKLIRANLANNAPVELREQFRASLAEAV